MTDFDFDPFLDWEAIDDEIAADFNKAIKQYRRATEAFAKMKRGDEDFAQAARTVLKCQMKVTRLSQGILSHIYTLPVMVHVAGERKNETNPDDPMQEGTLQRCSRCGSVLHFWHEGIIALTDQGPRPLTEEDVPWFEKGEIVAKGETQGGVSMYVIDPPRDLEKHERECVSLSDLVGDFDFDFGT